MKIPPEMQRGGPTSQTSEFLHSRDLRKVVLHVTYPCIHLVTTAPALKNQYLVLWVTIYT